MVWRSHDVQPRCGHSSRLSCEQLRGYTVPHLGARNNPESIKSFVRSIKEHLMRNQLTNRLSINDIYSLCLQTQGKENNCLKEELYQLTFDENDRVSFNALWALSHFDEANNPWLFQKHDELIDRVLVEKNETKRRLMLHLLLRQPFEEESLRSDFIDFCIAKITACSQPYAIRCYCMKLAYEQMKYYPELLEELRMALDMLEQEVLSPGLLSAKRQIMKKIKRSLGKFGK